MNLSVREITIAEFATLEQQIRASHIDFSSLVETWQSLDAYFNKRSVFDDEKFRWTYFRIYTELTWKIFGSQSRDFIVEVAVKRQIPMALQLDFDAIEEIIRYLGLRTVDKVDMQGLYLKMQKAFLESEAVVGVWQGKNFTVAEIVNEINSVYNTGDTLAQADFESRLRQMMFSDEVAKKYSTADPENAKERFLDLVSFFETYTQENIWFVVDAFLNPGKYQNVAPGGLPNATPVIVVSPKATSVKPIPQSVVFPPKKEEVKPISPAAPVTPLKLTPAQIKSQIEKEFSAEDMEGIMGKLNEWAEKNNDAKIAEMYYFDETENKFKWNI